MALRFPHGQACPTSATSYAYRPATSYETTPRVILDIAIEGIATEAMIDTGGAYLLCHPQLAAQLRLDVTDAMSNVVSILFRGVLVRGRLYRLKSLCSRTKVRTCRFKRLPLFPSMTRQNNGGEIPSILGFHGCLERIRIAIDPVTDTFYFGPMS